ncbi:hypothetical protein HKX48_001654 [Thoreauomyces humboldtii]|nr:hypothetical protein HKX48_001654 [Thoreauomyces humboldtii]
MDSPKVRFSPVHRYRNLGENQSWNDIGYVIRLVDAPVEFATLKPLIRPFAGYNLPRTMRLEVDRLILLARAKPCPIVFHYLMVVNKAYEYARSVLSMSGNTPRVPDYPQATTLAAGAARSGQRKLRTCDSVQLGAENIRVGDLVRGNIRSHTKILPLSMSKNEPAVVVLLVSQIRWDGWEPVRFLCKHVQFSPAALPLDVRDPTLCRCRGM